MQVSTNNNIPRNGSSPSIFGSFRIALNGGVRTTLRFLFLTRQGLALVGSTGLIIFIAYYVLRRGSQRPSNNYPYNRPPTSRTNNPSADRVQDEDEVEALIASLKSSGQTKRAALNDLYYLTNQKKKYKRLQQLKVPEILVKTLREASSDSGILEREDLLLLLKILNNLSASSDKLIRDSLAVGIIDLIALIEKGNTRAATQSTGTTSENSLTTDNGILEYSLRILMNLAVDQENEDRIREQEGIPPVIALLKDPRTDTAVLLQTSRLLINLVFNDQNKAVIVSEGGLEKVSELLDEHHKQLKGNETRLEELVTKLARLIGLLSQTPDLSVDLYESIVNESTAKAFVDLLDRKQANEKESAFLTSALLMILKKAKQDPSRYGEVLSKERGARFINTLAEGLPDLLIFYMKSTQKNVHTNAEALLKSLCELKGDITDEVLEKLSRAGLPSIAV